MYKQLRDGLSYGKAMFILSFLTFLCGMASCLVGDIFIPLSSAFYACLVYFEEKEKRFLSYIMPIAVLAISFIIGGAYSLIGVEFVLVGLLMVLLYHQCSTKGETLCYVASIISVFILIYLILYPLGKVETFNFEGIVGFYSKYLNSLRDTFVEIVSSLKLTAKDGTVQYLMSYEEAYEYFNNLIGFIPSVIIVIGLVLAGFSIKLFSLAVRRMSLAGLKDCYKTFLPASIVSYFYIAVYVFTVFSANETVFEVAVSNLSIILMVIYAYVGIRELKKMFSVSGKRSTFYIILVVAFLIAFASALQLLSFAGAYFSIVLSKGNPDKEKQN